MQSIDELAREITALPPSDQEALLDKVAQLNFQKGLGDLAEKYRNRITHEGPVDLSTDEVWVELHRIREEIAERDYSN